MKKLMIAAAAAVVAGGVFAADCVPEQAPVVENTLVYSLKMTVKTTKGLAGETVTNNGSICAPEDDVVTANVIRVKDSTKFEGWIYECTAVCNTIETGSVVAWDSKRKAQLTDAAFTTTFLNVIGKKQADAEWAWTFAGTAAYDTTRTQAYALTGAGIGKFSTKNGYYTSFSGNFAGTAAASFDLSKKNQNCDPSQVWKCDDLGTLADSDTVAYGTWTVKYNASASKKFAKNGYLKVPAYVTVEQ